MEAFFDFEKPIVSLEKKLQEMKELSQNEGVDLKSEITALEGKLAALIKETYSKLTRWQRVQVSRHPSRPYTKDYIDALFPDFMELAGDRTYADDKAIIAGVATWKSKPLMIIGHQKGRTTKQKMERNFGMVKPEGYRKAIRLMKLANRMRLPILTFIDTPGAYPGIDAEERGQSQAIAESILCMFELTVPVMSVVIGEGGSGGALAIGVANRVLMQEFSTYSVISPESCASILWSDARLAERASERLKMNPPDLLKLGVIDAIIHEPQGGAHRSWNETFDLMKKSLEEHLDPILKAGTKNSTGERLRLERIEKFRTMGQQYIGSTEKKGSSTPKKQRNKK